MIYFFLQLSAAGNLSPEVSKGEVNEFYFGRLEEICM
jgi:hypothetical protein